ncbi:MAG TPA: hypothetical protein VGG72_13285 [Bryobacteraceae bacterium]|jgi:hypothetical protein
MMRAIAGAAVVALGAFSSSITARDGQTAPSIDERDKALAGIQEYALDYARSLPDYTCIRVTQQKSPAVVAMKEELTVAGNRENYRVLKSEGNSPRGVKLVDQDYGTISVGEFSAVLGRIFAPDTLASFGWAGSSRLRGRAVLVSRLKFRKGMGHASSTVSNGGSWLRVTRA